MHNLLFPNQVKKNDLVRYYDVESNKLQIGLVVNIPYNTVNNNIASIHMLTKLGMQFNIKIRGCILVSRIKC